MNYYNDNNPFIVNWLKELIANKLIPKGEVDDRSISDISSADLMGYTQCHFFAGIAGWSVALQLAGWPANKSVWTGSCPCQPFSTAGKQKGNKDQRHLFPTWFRLIKQCKPPIIFGEQVAKKAGLQWWDESATLLEACDYACGAAVIPASAVGAWHQRERLWWTAIANAESQHRRLSNQPWQKDFESKWSGQAVRYTDSKRCQRNGIDQTEEKRQGTIGQDETSSLQYPQMWEQIEYVECLDGKRRAIPLEPVFCPLAHGIPQRVAKCAGFGNAIVPQVAAEFIQSAQEALEI